MERLEASQERQVEKDRPKGHEFSVFGSSHREEKAMHSHGLDARPPPRNSQGLSPATYFGIRQPGYPNDAAKVEMAQAPQRVIP
ncbi:hypothetical protein PR003_g28296 [Phytophthora rubi]|uniref:Uncharacterized protein n=1 Tax=Phytophthora rubi TaxID=129364 RepID=A0A6A4BSY8_9STRA|nr:hypothetical protein PR003_g28296 [Phytophthora rubi]